MKKLISVLLALVLVMGLVACGNTDTGNNTPETTQDTEGTLAETQDTEEVVEGTGEETLETVQKAEPNSATVALGKIWDAVAEDSKFFAMGGDMSEENMTDGAPGNYNLTDEGLSAMLLIPADQVANLAEASSLMHGMMANNFTCSMVKLAEGADAAAYADAMKAAISGNQWICGMPEKMLIAVIDGEYVLVAFGINDAINPFETALGTAYADADVKYNEAIAG